MIDAARPYAELLYPLVDPLHDVLTEAYVELLKRREHFPQVDGAVHRPTELSAFKGLILEQSPCVMGGFKIRRKNGASVSFIHDTHGLALSMRRPDGLNMTASKLPNLSLMPDDYALFNKPTPRELLATRRPGPNDISALTWDWPKKTSDGNWHWNLKFLLAAPGHALDDGSWALGLKLPREVKLDGRLSGFQPEESPLEFLANEDEEESK